MQSVRFKENCTHNRYKFYKGQAVEFPESEAAILVSRKVAERIESPKPKTEPAKR